jgi:hypothetical protein
VLLKVPEVMEVHSGCYEIKDENSHIVELLRPLHRSVGDFESSEDRCITSA